MVKERIIAFHRANKVGDNVVAIKALYALKELYPDFKLMVLTNGVGLALYRHLGFIDYIFDMDKSAEIAKVHELEFLIITHRCSSNIALAKSLNVRKIIMYAHVYSLFTSRFQVVFPRGINSHHESENLLYLVRAINKAHFDKNFPLIDFSQARLIAGSENRMFVEEFFTKEKLRRESKNLHSVTESCKSHQNTKPSKIHKDNTSKKIIAINIFVSFQKPCNFSLVEWVEIINTLCACFTKINFILTSFVGTQYDLRACKELNAPNCKIFVNNADILNLIALFERVDALISVDTGNIHIADNMRLPTFGLYNRAVLKRWGGGSYGGVFEAFCVENAPKVGDKELFIQKAIAFLERVCVS